MQAKVGSVELNFGKTVENVITYGFWVSAALFLGSLCVGIAEAGVPCDMDLATWNLVSSVILGLFVLTSGLIIFAVPVTLQTLQKVALNPIDVEPVLAQGILPASVVLSCGLLPILLLLWDIHGLQSTGYGTCSGTAPMLFRVSLAEMVVEILVIVGTIFHLLYSKSKVTGCIVGPWFSQCCSATCAFCSSVCSRVPWPAWMRCCRSGGETQPLVA